MLRLRVEFVTVPFCTVEFAMVLVAMAPTYTLLLAIEESETLVWFTVEPTSVVFETDAFSIVLLLTRAKMMLALTALMLTNDERLTNTIVMLVFSTLLF